MKRRTTGVLIDIEMHRVMIFWHADSLYLTGPNGACKAMLKSPELIHNMQLSATDRLYSRSMS